MADFSWLAASGGAIGVAWLELIRITGKVSRRRKLWNGLRPWQYALLAGGFGAVAFVFAGFATVTFVGAVVIGFGIEGGPVATGILAADRPQPGRVTEEISATSADPVRLRGFFTEP